MSNIVEVKVFGNSRSLTIFELGFKSRCVVAREPRDIEQVIS